MATSFPTAIHSSCTAIGNSSPSWRSDKRPRLRIVEVWRTCLTDRAQCYFRSRPLHSDSAQSLVSEIDRLAAESVTETRINAVVAGETPFFDRPVDGGGPQANSLSGRLLRRLGGKRPKIPAAPILDTALLEIDLARLQRSRREMLEPAITENTRRLPMDHYRWSIFRPAKASDLSAKAASMRAFTSGRIALPRRSKRPSMAPDRI